MFLHLRLQYAYVIKQYRSFQILNEYFISESTLQKNSIVLPMKAALVEAYPPHALLFLVICRHSYY